VGNYEKVITLRFPKKGGETEQKKPPQAVKYSKPLARRKVGGIRFFDMGWIKSGSEYITLPYVDPQGNDDFGGQPAEGVYTGVDGSLGADNFADRDALIFAVPQSEWTRNFKQITDTETSVYNGPTVVYKGTSYFLFNESAFWTGGRFKPNVEPVGSTVTFTLPASAWWGSSFPNANHKITATHDYSAPAVTMELGTNFDVFMFPWMFFMSSLTQHNPSFGVRIWNLLTYSFAIAPRDVLMNPSNPYYDWRALVGSGAGWGPSSPISDYEDWYYTTAMIQEYFPYRANQATGLAGVYTHSATSPNNFLTGYSSSPPADPTLTSLNAGMAATFPAFTGWLIAVIKQGSDYYYIWWNV
jgi:hypothetical protein